VSLREQGTDPVPINEHPQAHNPIAVTVTVWNTASNEVVSAFVAGSIAEADFRLSRILPTLEIRYGSKNLDPKFYTEGA